MASSHLVTDAQFALARDINLDLLNDSGIDIVAALYAVCRPIAFKLQLRELVLVRTNDFANSIADRTRIDLDMIVRHRQLS